MITSSVEVLLHELLGLFVNILTFLHQIQDAPVALMHLRLLNYILQHLCVAKVARVLHELGCVLQLLYILRFDPLGTPNALFEHRAVDVVVISA